MTTRNTKAPRNPHSWNTAPLTVDESVLQRFRKRARPKPAAIKRVPATSPGASARRELRNAYIEFVYGISPNLFLTFSFGYVVGHIKAQGLITKFFNAAQRRALGRNWTKWPENERPRAIGFFEHEHSNPHYHVLVNVDGLVADVLATDGASIWASLASRGSYDFAPISSPREAIRYCTKELTMQNRSETVFTYSPVDKNGKR